MDEYGEDVDSSLLKHVVKRVEKSGLLIPTKPMREPEIPDDITTSSSEQLMSYMNWYTNANAHAAYLLAVSEIDSLAKRSKYRLSRAKKFLQKKENGYDRLNKKIPVKEIDSYLDADEDLDILNREATSAEAYQIIVQKIQEGYTAKYQVLSRELTRRGTTGHYKE